MGIKCRIVADHDVPLVVNAITGANEGDYHLANVNVGRDYTLDTTFDLRNAAAGDPSPRGEGTLELVHGIEVGHVFKLGTKYSTSMDAMYDDETENRQPIIMGCYGIGVNRILAGLAETRYDENGLIWPLSIAPYEVIISVIGANEPETLAAAETFYGELKSAGVDVLLDERDLRPGVKFKDADLIGIPLRVNFGGKGLKEGIVELKWRTSTESERVQTADAVKTVLEQLAAKKKSDAANVPQ